MEKPLIYEQVKKDVYDIVKRHLDTKGLTDTSDLPSLASFDEYTYAGIFFDIDKKYNLEIPDFEVIEGDEMFKLRSVNDISKMVYGCVTEKKYQKQPEAEEVRKKSHKLDDILMGVVRGTGLVHGGLFSESNDYYKKGCYYENPVLYRTSKLVTSALEIAGYCALARSGYPGFLAIPAATNFVRSFLALNRNITIH